MFCETPNTVIGKRFLHLGTDGPAATCRGAFFTFSSNRFQKLLPSKAFLSTAKQVPGSSTSKAGGGSDQRHHHRRQHTRWGCPQDNKKTKECDASKFQRVGPGALHGGVLLLPALLTCSPRGPSAQLFVALQNVS